MNLIRRHFSEVYICVFFAIYYVLLFVFDAVRHA